MFGLQPQQLVFLVILVVAFALLITEKLRNDLVAVLIILALSISGVLEPKEALSGPPLTALRGRWSVERGLVLTAIVL